MRRINLGLVLTLAVIISGLLLASTAKAETIMGRHSIGIFPMYVNSLTMKIHVYDDNYDASNIAKFDSSTGYGFVYTYGISDKRAVSLSFDKSSHDLTDEDDMKFGSFDLTTLLISYQWRSEMASSRFSPFFGLGLGWTFVSGNLDQEFKSYCSVGTPTDAIHTCFENSITDSDSFALSLGGGTDFFLTNHIALSLEGRYTGGYASGGSIRTVYDVKSSLTNYTSSEKYSFKEDLGRANIILGIKYFF